MMGSIDVIHGNNKTMSTRKKKQMKGNYTKESYLGHFSCI
jgi:hypothetical protein